MLLVPAYVCRNFVLACLKAEFDCQVVLISTTYGMEAHRYGESIQVVSNSANLPSHMYYYSLTNCLCISDTVDRCLGQPVEAIHFNPSGIVLARSSADYTGESSSVYS
jgi:hypothetical protein